MTAKHLRALQAPQTPFFEFPFIYFLYLCRASESIIFLHCCHACGSYSLCGHVDEVHTHTHTQTHNYILQSVDMLVCGPVIVMWHIGGWRLQHSRTYIYICTGTNHAITNATHDFPIIPNYVNHSCETRRFNAQRQRSLPDTAAAKCTYKGHRRDHGGAEESNRKETAIDAQLLDTQLIMSNQLG